MVMRAEEQPAWLPVLAEALVEALPRLTQTEQDPRLAELIRALTAALARGEPELRLHAPAPAEVDAHHWPDGHREALEGSPLASPPLGPLVLDDGRIVWRRWWERRQSVLENLIRRAETTPSGAPAAGEPPPEEPAAEASEGIRQSPRGDSAPPDEIFGPFGTAERLNWLAKKRFRNSSSQRLISGRS